jgi:WD40 repeat protein
MRKRLHWIIDRLLNAVMRRLFGDDIFISYSRADGATYAAGLANELVALGYACRFDQWGTEPNAELPRSLITAIRRSAMFVLVASSGAAASNNVGKEIEAYRATGRIIIPIDIASAIGSAIWKGLVVGLAVSPETVAVLETGTPSAAVVNRIEKSFTFRRRDQRLRLIAAATAGVVGVIALIGVFATQQTIRKTAEAERATRLAETQTRIAEARGLSNQAEFLASQQPAEIEAATLLATESAQRFESVEAQQALEHTLTLLPRKIASLSHGTADGDEITQIRFSADGKRIVTCDGLNAIVWSALDGAEIRSVRHEVRQLRHWGDGQTTAITSAALSADGSYVVTGGEDNTARIWSVDEPDKHPTMLHHSGRVDDVAFEPLHGTIATASEAGVILWGRQGNKLKEMPTVEHARRIIFSADGRFLAAMSKGKLIAADVYISVFELPGGQEVTKIVHKGKGPTGNYIPAFDFSRDGKLVASGNADGWARVWAVPSGAEIWSWYAGKGIGSVRLSTNGELVAVASWGTDARVWDIQSDQERARLVHGGVVLNVEFSPDGRLVATGATDRVVRIWDVTSGRELQRLPHTEGKVVPVISFSPGGTRVVSANGDAASLWDIEDTVQPRSVSAGYAVARMAISRNAASLAVIPGGYQHDVDALMWKLPAGDEIRLPHRLIARMVRYSPNGSLLLTTDDSPEIALGEEANFTAIVWDVATGARVSSVKHLGDILSSAFSPNGELVATGSADGKVLVWQARDGIVRKTQSYLNPKTLAFSEDSLTLVVAGGSNVLHMRINTSETKDMQLPSDDGEVVDKLSDDGAKLLLRDHNRTARVLDAVSGKQLCAIADPGDHERLAWSSRGRYLAMVDTGLRLTITNVATCQPVSGANLTGEVIKAIAFSPDEAYVATLTESGGLTIDRRISVWTVQTGVEVARRLSTPKETGGETLVFSEDGDVLGAIERASSLDYYPQSAYVDTILLWHWTLREAIENACTRLRRDLAGYTRACPEVASSDLSRPMMPHDRVDDFTGTATH